MKHFITVAGILFLGSCKMNSSEETMVVDTVAVDTAVCVNIDTIGSDSAVYIPDTVAVDSVK